MLHRNHVARLLMSSLLVASAVPVVAITTAPSWKPRETVTDTLGNPSPHQGADRVLAYDHHGNPGIAFYDTVDGDLRYARRVPGVGWVHSVVDPNGDLGKFPSLAYDRYERPAISYFDDSNDNLKYAHFDGAAWQIETIDSTGDVGQYTTLAFDLLGRPAVAYHDISNTSLKYITDTDGDFSLADETPVTVVNEFNDGRFPTLVFDPLNRPMIAHLGGASEDLRFSVEEPGIGWVTTTVDTLNTTQHVSIAIDPDTGHPAIAYFDILIDDLRYAAWDGNTWNLTTVDSVGILGPSPSLAFDPADGNPAISYWDQSPNSDLKLAWHDGNAWQTQTVDAVGNVGFGTSLAFNDFGTGFPSISYFENVVGGNLYFIEDPPAAVPEPGSLVLLAIGMAAICFRRRET